MTTRIRQSEITRWQRCRRSHHFGYTRGVVPVGLGPRRPASSHRDAGSAAHRGIEVFNETDDLDAALDAVREWVEETRHIRAPEGVRYPPLSKETDKEWWEVERLALAMTENYTKWLGEGNEAGVTILGTEIDWEVELPNGIVIFGKIDAIVHDPLLNGIVVRDYKSVATFDQSPLPVDFQLLTYAYAWSRIGEEPPVRAEHLMMKRVLGTAKATPPFFERYPINVTPRILRRHEEHLIARTNEIAASVCEDPESPLLWPNPTKDCSWDCDYRVLCPMVDNGQDWEAVLEESFAEKLDDE